MRTQQQPAQWSASMATTSPQPPTGPAPTRPPLPSERDRGFRRGRGSRSRSRSRERGRRRRGDSRERGRRRRSTSRDRGRRRSRSPRRGSYGDHGRRWEWGARERERETGQRFDTTYGNSLKPQPAPSPQPQPAPIAGGLTILEAAGADKEHDDWASVQAAVREAGFEADPQHKPPSLIWMTEYKSKTEDPAAPGAVSTTETEDSDCEFVRRMRRKRAEYEAKLELKKKRRMKKDAARKSK